jgi:2-succinyl-5-enolpyruvyl-6-hydroxy-3-cyclohexene-1-carboxylate synthase
MATVTADPNLNARWCRCLAEELARSGTARVLLSPGSRNSPLLAALHAQFGGRCVVHVDERSAGFIALGLAKALAAPVALCVTSGSAVANLLPAIAEAHAAGVPLIVISADRPWDAQACAAPQTMAQPGLFARFVAGEVALGEPTDDEVALRALRARVAWLVQHARLARRPAHLNVPLREPLAPLPDPVWQPRALSSEALHGRVDGKPFVRLADDAVRGGADATAAWRALLGALPAAPRGLIVAGPDCPLPPGAVRELAAATRFPVLADAPGALRDGLDDGLVTTLDALAGGALGATQADLVIQLGPAPLARAAFEWLDRQRCPWLVLTADARDQDFLHRAHAAAVVPPADGLAALAAACGRGDEGWRQRWLAADAAARRALAAGIADEAWGEPLAASLSVNHPGFALLHLASSMAVRHGNLHCQPTRPGRRIHANRGLNGIDGTLGTFLGELAATPDANGLLLCGDLAFLHDLPALAAAGGLRGRGAIVVLNNDGGGIFDFLAVARMPAYRELVRTPHGRDLAGAAALFGLPYRQVAARQALAEALAAAASGPGLTLIECTVAPGAAVGRHRALLAAMATAADRI